MIHRLQRGEVPAKPHTVFEQDGSMAFEHCFTRRGFDGLFTIFYHRVPPHWVQTDEELGTHPGWAPTLIEGGLKRRHYRSPELPRGGQPFLARKLILDNPDCGVWMVHADQDDETLVANGDADELAFVEHGSGWIDTPQGVVRYQPQDYVYIPRSLPHRWRLSEPTTLMVFEGKTYIDVPKQFRVPGGQLDIGAPYSHRDFREPEWPSGGAASLDAPRRMIVKRNEALTAYEMTDDPFDVIGWDGQVWPFAFPIRAYQPKTGQIHLPPTVHLTFAGGGFIICSFVPRLLDYHEKAIPCPYVHSSVDCDEIILYVEGDFTSRKGMDVGSISLHPAGVAHGPHPGRYEASVGVRETKELAVMCDTFKPLLPTKHAVAIEDGQYNRSWHTAPPAASKDFLE